MDFHTLPRRDLQALCKKNRIPANMTNLAMADALQALKTVEGIDEIQETQQFQSPKKAEARSPDLPRTSRRTSVRRGPIRENLEDHPESSLPRAARRVTLKASAIKKSVEEEEGQKQEGSKEIPDTPATCNSRRTRGRRQEGPMEIIPNTPATLSGRKTSVRQVEKVEKGVGLKTYNRRTTRQSSMKQPEETMDSAVDVGRRSTRGKSTVKMAALVQEGDEKDLQGVVISDEVSGDVTAVISGKKSDELMMEEEVTVVLVGASGGTGDLMVEDEGCEPDPEFDLESGASSEHRFAGEIKECVDGPDQELESLDSTRKEEENLKTGNGGSEHASEPQMGGEGSLDRALEDDQKMDDESPKPKGEIAEDILDLDLRNVAPGPEEPPIEEEEKGGNVDLALDLQGPPRSNEIPTNIEDSGNFFPSNNDPQIGDTSDLQAKLEIEIADSTIQFCNEILTTGEKVTPASESVDSDSSDEVIAKDEEANLYMLTGEIPEEEKDSGDDLPLNQTPDTEDSSDPRAETEIADSPTKFSGENPVTGDKISPASYTLDSDSSGDLIKKDEESNIDLRTGEEAIDSGDCLPVIQVLETDISSDLQAASEFSGEFPATDGPIFSETLCDELAVEISPETKNSSDDTLITDQSKPSPLQQQILLHNESPTKIPADGGDLIRNSPYSDRVAPASGLRDTLHKSGGERVSKGSEKKKARRVSFAIYTSENQVAIDDKENTNAHGLTSLTNLVVGGGEAKAVKDNAEKGDLNGLSLRKLKLIYKEKVTDNTNKVEEKRSALTAINENCL